MAGLEDLAAALLGQSTQAEIAKENPYYGLAEVPESLGGSVVQLMAKNPRKYSMKEGLAWGIGSGLLGGLLRGQGDSYQNTLTNRYTQQVGNAMNAEAGEIPSVEGLPSILTKSANQGGSLFRLQRDIQNAQKEQDYEMERRAKLQDALLAQGLVVGEDGKLAKINALDPVSIETQKAGAKTKAELDAQNEYWGLAKPGEVQGGIPVAGRNPNSPQTKQLMGLETDTYNRITKLPSYTQFSDIDANFRTLRELAKEDSRSASVGMISALARIWDPMGTVREGEYALNSQAQSALDSTIGNWRELVMGKGKLGKEGKQSILSAASKKYNEFGKKYSDERDALYVALEGQGGSRKNIPTPGYEPFEMESGGLDLQAAALAELKRRGVVK